MFLNELVSIVPNPCAESNDVIGRRIVKKMSLYRKKQLVELPSTVLQSFSKKGNINHSGLIVKVKAAIDAYVQNDGFLFSPHL